MEINQTDENKEKVETLIKDMPINVLEKIIDSLKKEGQDALVKEIKNECEGSLKTLEEIRKKHLEIGKKIEKMKKRYEKLKKLRKKNGELVDLPKTDIYDIKTGLINMDGCINNNLKGLNFVD